MVYRVTGIYEVGQEAARPVAWTLPPQRSYMHRIRPKKRRGNRGFSVSRLSVQFRQVARNWWQAELDASTGGKLPSITVLTAKCSGD